MTNRKISFAVFLLAVVACSSLLNAQVRTSVMLEKGWRFTREDQKAFSAPDYDDSEWERVTVPHDWAIYGPFSSSNDKQETVVMQDGMTNALEHVGRTGWHLKCLRFKPEGKRLSSSTEL